MTTLKCLRTLYELTQQDVERLSGVSRWKISLAEVGKFRLSDEELDAIAGVFDVKPAELLSAPNLGGSKPAFRKATIAAK